MIGFVLLLLNLYFITKLRNIVKPMYMLSDVPLASIELTICFSRVYILYYIKSSRLCLTKRSSKKYIMFRYNIDIFVSTY